MGSFFIDSPTYGRHEVLYDDEDWELIKDYKWSVRCLPRKDGRQYFYVQAHDCIDGKDTVITMHRLVYNFPENKDVDHKNHNGLDNRKENLRISNKSQNNYNQEIRGGGSSIYKGVYKTQRHKEVIWVARITVDYKIRHLGSFSTEEEAAHQYDYYALKYGGEFANLNFPEFDYSNYVPKNVNRIKKTSKYKGAFYVSDRRKWYATISLKGKLKHLGSFETETDAAMAYNQYVIENGLNRKLNEVD